MKTLNNLQFLQQDWISWRFFNLNSSGGFAEGNDIFGNGIGYGLGKGPTSSYPFGSCGEYGDGEGFGEALGSCEIDGKWIFSTVATQGKNMINDIYLIDPTPFGLMELISLFELNGAL